LTVRTGFWHNKARLRRDGYHNRPHHEERSVFDPCQPAGRANRQGQRRGHVRDGKILGGDAYLFYTGSYTAKGDTFKGEVLVQRHTSSPMPTAVRRATPVGIGVSGTFTDTAGVMNGTALVGKASQIFKATLRKLADTD